MRVDGDIDQQPMRQRQLDVLLLRRPGLRIVRERHQLGGTQNIERHIVGDGAHGDRPEPSIAARAQKSQSRKKFRRWPEQSADETRCRAKFPRGRAFGAVGCDQSCEGCDCAAATLMRTARSAGGRFFGTRESSTASLRKRCSSSRHVAHPFRCLPICTRSSTDAVPVMASSR